MEGRSGGLPRLRPPRHEKRVRRPRPLPGLGREPAALRGDEAAARADHLHVQGQGGSLRPPLGHGHRAGGHPGGAQTGRPPGDSGVRPQH